jgi:hypothetical protein
MRRVGDQNAPAYAQPTHHDVLIGVQSFTHADRDVEALFHQVDPPIRDRESQSHLRISSYETGENRRQYVRQQTGRAGD